MTGIAQADHAEQIVITGTRTQHKDWSAPIATEYVDVEAATREGKATVSDVLQSLPGVELVSGIRGHSIRLDGLDSKYTAVLIDGQRVNGRIGESQDLDRIPLSSIDHIEIVRGASSALYGSEALGGVINIISKKAYKNRIQVRLGQDSLVKSQADLSADARIGNTFSFGLDAHALQSRELKLDGTEAASFSGRYERGVTLRPRVAGKQWEVDSSFSLDLERIHGTDVSGPGAVTKRDNEIETRRARVSPSYTFDGGSSVRADASSQIYKDDYEVKLRRTGALQSEEETTERNNEFTLSTVQDLDTHQVTIGSQSIAEAFNSDRLNQDEVKRRRQALYLQDEWTLGDLMIVPGIRYDDDSQYDEHTAGKLAFRYALDENRMIRASYGEGYRAPAFKELYMLFENSSVGYVVEGNPDLKPETSRGSRLSFDQRNGAWRFGIEGFHNLLKDMIYSQLLEADSSGLIRYSYQNIESAETLGANLSVKHNRFSLQYGYLQARNLSDQTEIYGRSKHSAGYRYRYPIDEFWSFSHGFKWQSARSLGPGAPGKALFTGDASLEYAPFEDWRFSLNANNITAQSGDAFGRLPPRSVGLAVTWKHNS